MNCILTDDIVNWFSIIVYDLFIFDHIWYKFTFYPLVKSKNILFILNIECNTHKHIYPCLNVSIVNIINLIFSVIDDIMLIKQENTCKPV